MQHAAYQPDEAAYPRRKTCPPMQKETMMREWIAEQAAVGAAMMTRLMLELRVVKFVEDASTD